MAAASLKRLLSQFRGTRRALGFATLTSAGGMAANIGVQIVLPPVLLSRWGDGGYALYVAVVGFASYLGLADAGVQVFLTQRLTALRSCGDSERAARLARGGLRALLLLALVGLAVLVTFSVLAGASITRRISATANISSVAAVTCIVAQLVSGASALATGGWSTAVEQATARYARTPAVALLRSLTVALVLITSALMKMPAPVGITAAALATLPIDLVRFWLARHLIQVTPQGDPVLDVLRGSRGSLVMMIAWSTQNGLYPAVAASVSPTAAAVAVPGRTVSNVARFLSTAVQSVFWPPVAARLATERAHDRALAFWSKNSPLLMTVQVLGVLLLVAAAPIAVPMWLPTKADSILDLLPLYCLEQGLFVAVMPSQVLLTATGMFALLGGAQLVTALVTLGATVLMMPRWGAFGFAAASALATLACSTPAMITGEWFYWRKHGCNAGWVLGPRLTVAIATAASALWVRSHPVLTAGYVACVLCGVLLFARSARRDDMRQPAAP